MNAKEIKATLIAAAATAAAPVIARAAASTNYPVDPAMKDENLRLMNVFAFEVTQVLYNAFKLAYENNEPNAWPDPVSVASASPAPPISGPIPNPGANLAGTIAQVAGAVAGAIH